jgi:hypothetical protein
VIAHRSALFLAVVALSAWVLPGVVVSSASAQPCPDVEVVFARGTSEPAGVGATGQEFIDALVSRIGGRSLGVYPVDYPATWDFATGVDGVRDARAHVESTAADCPKTKMVLGGYSQGAAVMAHVTSAAAPAGVDPAEVPKPMPPEVADHVAAVTLLGTPKNRFMAAPPIASRPLYAAKTIELCTDADPVCSDGADLAAHHRYADDGMLDRASDFAATHLGLRPGGDAPPRSAADASQELEP